MREEADGLIVAVSPRVCLSRWASGDLPGLFDSIKVESHSLSSVNCNSVNDPARLLLL